MKEKGGKRQKNNHKHAKNHAGGSFENDNKAFSSVGYGDKVAYSGELQTHNPYEQYIVTPKSPEPFDPPTPKYKCEEPNALLYVRSGDRGKLLHSVQSRLQSGICQGKRNTMFQGFYLF